MEHVHAVESWHERYAHAVENWHAMLAGLPPPPLLPGQVPHSLLLLPLPLPHVRARLLALRRALRRPLLVPLPVPLLPLRRQSQPYEAQPLDLALLPPALPHHWLVRARRRPCHLQAALAAALLLLLAVHQRQAAAQWLPWPQGPLLPCCRHRWLTPPSLDTSR